MSHVISEYSRDNADMFRLQFEQGDPFKHVCVDGFLDAALATRLVEEFPSFAKSRAVNEFGEDGNKDVNSDIQSIGPAYKAIHAALESGEITKWLTSITGIEGLVWGGDNMYGGGTHENLHNAELDIHLDFNYDDRNQYHRRLNLLVYLNPGWQEEWGGSLELHKDPREPETNYFKAFSPIFNRAIIHETSHKSWHGFQRINIPKDKGDESRKSLALYFYTKDRPQDEIRGNHTTHYVHFPLPDDFQIGATVTEDMYHKIHNLILKRDLFLKFYQNKEVEQAAVIKHLSSRVLPFNLPPVRTYTLRFLSRVKQALLKILRAFKLIR
ncbi:2OG-Fe(II) oxygenase [Oceanicaulis sp. LC35]|uniref:2OG-Fe(II) oxygenase n=1 Tax=Oceanicaulis sp. LC35 TaxID=3349635 RepID=UPI003F86CC1C